MCLIGWSVIFIWKYFPSDEFFFSKYMIFPSLKFFLNNQRINRFFDLFKFVESLTPSGEEVRGGEGQREF